MFNQPLQNQITELEKILSKSKLVNDVLLGAEELNAPNWYLGAGCISQSVWNYLHGYEIEKHIKDCDLVYFDDDISKQSEQKYIQKGKELFKDLSAEVEIVNQARVHLWYEKDFGLKIPPYQSVEEGINSWPTTITCIAVRKAGSQLDVYAPYGLNDLFGMILRPNKQMVTEEMYNKKVQRWTKVWPKLKVIEW